MAISRCSPRLLDLSGLLNDEERAIQLLSALRNYGACPPQSGLASHQFAREGLQVHGAAGLNAAWFTLLSALDATAVARRSAASVLSGGRNIDAR
jgi:hypothetical protein